MFQAFSLRFFSIDSYHALKISLNHRDQTEVSSLNDFSKNLYTFTYFRHHTAIYSFSNWFICFDFGYFFYNKDFFAFCKIFSTSHIARGITKLIVWTTPSLEERLDLNWDYVINMKCKQSNDVSTQAQKYLPVFKKTTDNSEPVTHESYIKLISWVAVYTWYEKTVYLCHYLMDSCHKIW